MKFKRLLPLMFLFTTLSCNKILFYAAGLRQPKEETKVTLKEFVHENGVDTNLIYIPKDTQSFYKLNRMASALSGYAFFDKNKKMLMYKDTGSACSAPVYVFVKNICSSNNPYYYKNYTTDIISERIIPICNVSSAESEYDFYVYIFWYKYFGKTKFKDEIKQVVDVLNGNSCNAKIYLVNLDLQPGWKKDIPIKIN